MRAPAPRTLSLLPSLSLSLPLALSLACSSKPPIAKTSAPPAPPPAAKPIAEPIPPPAAPEVLAADAPKTTTGGNTFIAPAGWSIVVRGSATILETPEGDSHIALVDLKAKDADDAIALAWAAYNPEKKWPVKVTNDAPDKDGWSRTRVYLYQTSPNEKRYVVASTRFANELWTVTIYDMSDAVRVASRKNLDGTISFITTAPGITGFELVVGGGAKRTLVMRDAQHEYVFDEKS